nr:hypothetical protein [Tanacetum cinerariifolium]
MGTSHSLSSSAVTSFSLRIGTSSSTPDFIISSVFVSEVVLGCSYPILGEYSGSLVDRIESDNSLSDNFSLEFETFCDHTEETRSGITTTHADDSLPEYDSFCFEIEPDKERLINVVKNDISNESTNDPLLEEADLFLASDNSIPPGIENFANDSEGDIRFLEALLSNDSIPFSNNKSSESDFDKPPSEPPYAEYDFEPDTGDEIPIVMNDKDDFDDDYSSFMFVICSKIFLSFLSAESEDTIFDP